MIIRTNVRSVDRPMYHLLDWDELSFWCLHSIQLPNHHCFRWWIGACSAPKHCLKNPYPRRQSPAWWRNQMDTFSAFNWPFVRGIHRWPVNSPHKGQWRGTLMFSLVCARTNGWVNHRDAGDLGRHRAHYDVTPMRLESFASWLTPVFVQLLRRMWWLRSREISWEVWMTDTRYSDAIQLYVLPKMNILLPEIDTALARVRYLWKIRLVAIASAETTPRCQI